MPPAPKLTDDQAREIHRRRTEETPQPSWRELAAEYGVAHTMVKGAFDRVVAALHPTAAPAEPAPAPVAVVAAPHDRIAPSPLNPRKRFDPEAHERMVDSVRDKGVLIPLMVRRANQPGNTPVGADVDYEIIGGERRWRGAEALIAAGEWVAHLSMPIKLIDPCDDATYLELALTENGVRKDMTPWEEAEAFAALHQLGRSAAEIGKAYGMVKRTVEMRIRLVRDLGHGAKNALRDGKISVEAANILAAFCPPVSQDLALNKIANGNFPTTRDLKRYLTQALIPTSVAFFPVSDYTGDLIADESDPDKAYFSDSKLFEKLQQKAIAEAEMAAKGKGYAWTKVLDNRKAEWFSTGDFVTDAKAPERGVVYEIKSNGLVVVHTDVVSLASRAKDTAKAAGLLGGAEASPITKAHFAHARRRKTVALQSSMARAPMVAMRAMCLGLIGCGENIRIRTEHQGADDKVDSPDVVATIEKYLPRFAHVCKEGFEVAAGDVRRKNWCTGDDGAAWDVLANMTDDEVCEFFAALTALRVGSFATYNPEAGDRPAVIGMARMLGLIGAEADHGLALRREDLEGLRKPALLDVKYQVCRDDQVADLNLAGLKDHLMVADPDYVLPTLRFGDKATVEALFKAPAEDSRQIDLEESIAVKVARAVRTVIADTIDRPVSEVSDDLMLSQIGTSAKLTVMRAEIAAVLGVEIGGGELWPVTTNSTVADLIAKVQELHQQRYMAKAAAPSGDLDICLMSLRRVLSAHSVFAAKAEGETGFPEIIGEEDFPRVAEDIAKAFGVPTITADVLYTIEDLDHLTLVIENHRAALATGEAA